jgi:uncharacterized membrane protein
MMIELVLVIFVLAIGVTLMGALGRLAEVERVGDSLRLRLAGLEDQLKVVAPEPILPFRTALPPKGGSHEIDRGNHEIERGNHEIDRGGHEIDRGGHEAPSPESRGFRLQAEEVPTEGAPISPLSFRLHAEADDASESIETTIGSRWLLYIGIVAIVIGTAYFEKLAIDNNWLGETARVIQGGVVGLLLTYAGLRFVRAGYDAYGQIITGGGAAILYLSTYAAFNFYHLIPQPAAFALMVAITAMVAWLADRLHSQGLALFAVGGGFAAPFLVPGTTDAQIALFGYDTILIGGTMFLSHRRSWPALNIVSYIATLATVAAWADTFYTPEKYLRTELFLTLFCAMFLYILRRIRTATGGGAEAAALILWTVPVAYYAASLMVLQDHSTALLVWFVALMLTGGILSDRVGTGAGLAVWGAVTVPLLLWTVTHLNPIWHTSGLSTIAAVYLIALAAQLRRTFAEGDAPVMSVADIVWLHLNGLLMFAAAYFLIDETHVAITGALAAAFALWQGVLAAIVLKRQRDQARHFAALGFTLLSIAIGLQWDGPAVTIGWAAEGAAIVALGLYERRQWMRVAGGVLFTVAFGQASVAARDRKQPSARLSFSTCTRQPPP